MVSDYWVQRNIYWKLQTELLQAKHWLPDLKWMQYTVTRIHWQVGKHACPLLLGLEGYGIEGVIPPTIQWVIAELIHKHLYALGVELHPM